MRVQRVARKKSQGRSTHFCVMFGSDCERLLPEGGLSWSEVCLFNPDRDCEDRISAMLGAVVTAGARSK